MQKDLMKLIFIFLLFSTFNSIEEIEYRIVHAFITRIRDRFSVKFNKINGIKAEYEEMEPNYDNGNISRGKKIYNITNEELGLPNNKELFKLFDKIDFPEETNWNDRTLFDVPVWHLIVDGKDYHSNVGTEFMSKFQKIVNVYDIMNYCKENYGL